MKKSRRILCMLLAAVMLSGVVPAQAAAPLSPLAALLAVPVSGQIMNAGPVSDSISKALTVSKPAEPAPAPAPAPEPTPAPAAPSASPAPNGRLPDGTTGATVGVPGTATYVYNSANKDRKDQFYGNKKSVDPNAKKYLFSPDTLTSANAKANPTIYVTYNPQRVNLSMLAGLTVPGGCIADVYNGTTFVCQYDTRDGKDLVIPCAPGSTPEQAQALAAQGPAKGRTTFNDVKPGDWYYEAVTALAEGNVLHTVFDLDPNGNFGPNKMLDSGELVFINNRLKGHDTEGMSLVYSGVNTTREYVATAVSLFAKNNGMTPAAGNDIYTPQNQSADAKAIRVYAQFKKDTAPNNPERKYATAENCLARAYDLGLVRTPGSPEVLDFNAGLSRAEFCYLLYKAGMTSFGCDATK